MSVETGLAQLALVKVEGNVICRTSLGVGLGLFCREEGSL